MTVIPGNYTLMSGTTGNHVNVTLYNPDGTAITDLSSHGAAQILLVAPDKTQQTVNATVSGGVVTLATLPNTFTQAGLYTGQVLFADGSKSSTFQINVQVFP